MIPRSIALLTSRLASSLKLKSKIQYRDAFSKFQKVHILRCHREDTCDFNQALANKSQVPYLSSTSLADLYMFLGGVHMIPV